MTFPQHNTHKVLIRRGIVSCSGEITPLGLAVRAYLMEKNMTEPTVTQVDRDAVAHWLLGQPEVFRGSTTSLWKLLSAHHREAERATIKNVVAFLRENYASDWVEVAADAIERGEWKEMGHD